METSYTKKDEAVVPGETPLEAAARAEAARDPVADQNRREEREADMLVADIDSYVARTDPDSLPQAEQELNAWEIPSDPLEQLSGHPSVPSEEEGEPLVSVFTAQSESEANIVRGVVEASGIPVVVNGLAAPIMGSIFQAGESRWADILVPASLAEAARTAISESMSSTANPQGRD